MTFINKLMRDEQGATAIEYGLIAALIAVAAISTMSSLGGEVRGTFNDSRKAMREGRKTGK